MTAPASTAPPSTEPPVTPPVGGTQPGTQDPPEGFVPRGELEREQARARTFQAEADRAKAALAARDTPTPPKAGEPTPTPDFDPAEFRRSLLADTQSVLELTQAVGTLKGEFPHADPAIYSRLADFGSADALRLAVEDSHARVAAILDTEKTAIETRLREEYGEKHGGATPPGTPPATPAGDPTVADLHAMTISELAEYDKANPGVVERVLSSATA